MPDAIFLAEAAQAEAARLRAALEAAGVRAELRSVPDPVRGQPSPELGAGVGVLSVFVGSRVDRATLDACPDLRLVATRSTGYDHVDLAACTARGGLVDAEALLWALDEGILAGAGLDVLEGEELLAEDRRRLALERDEASLRVLVENQLLAGREDVVVTPHVGFDSVEAVQRIAEVTAANIAAFLAGHPQNLVS